MFRIIVIISIGLLAVSSASIMIKWCDAPALSIAAYRLALASLTLLLWGAVQRKRWWQDLTKKEWILSLASGAFLAIHFASWISSLKLTSITNSVVLVTTSPFWVAIASRVFLKVALKRSLVISFLVAFVGVVIMTLQDAGHSSHEQSFFGDFLALVGAWAAAGYILCGRVVRRRIDNLSYITIIYSIAAIFLVGIAVVSQSPLVGFSKSTYTLFIGIALIPQLIGHSSFNWALKHLSAPLVSTLLLGEPVLASILAFFLLNESPSLGQAGGAVLVIIGVFGAIWSEKNRE